MVSHGYGLVFRLLKVVAHEIAVPFTLIFQNSFDAGILPQDWKNGHVIPILKKGSRKAPAWKL